MSLSKQLYIIISIIFFIIFTGNFIISVKNTKEYLQIESQSKAQDTATSLGMSLKPLLNNKRDPEVESIINAIATSGFYKEIRLEDAYFTISEGDLIIASTDLDESVWKISNLSVEKKYGTVDLITSDLEITKELLALENETSKDEPTTEINEDIYTFNPTPAYKNGGNITFKFIATNEKGKKIDAIAHLTINRVLIRTQRDVKFDYIPHWFINLIPIELDEKFSEINDGWKTTAKIFVSANPGDAYAKLYEQAKSAIIYAIIAFIISMISLFFFVQYLLKPLKKLEKLANNIANGKFGTIKHLPWTSEIKAVAIAFNLMSTKIEEIINKLNKNLEIITKKLSQDEVTGLALKQSFETDMKNMFINKSNGFIFIIKIFDLATFAKSHTNSEVNDFIRSFADVLKNTKVRAGAKTTAYRFFGSEFAVIGEKLTFEDTEKYIKDLQNNFEKLSLEFNKSEIVHIGATEFNPIGTTPEILQSANEAYERASIIGVNESFISDSTELSRDMESWRELVFDIIDNSKFDVKYIGDSILLNNSSNDIYMQEAFTNIKDKDDNPIAIGTFVSIAERYEKIVEFDKKVISKVISHILLNNLKHSISINLSLESMNNTAFIAWVEKKILENKKIANQLVFSATAYAVAKDVDKFKFFVDEIHKCGAKIIIKRFETKFIPLDSIKNLNLDYIRLARDYTSDISHDTSKQSFVESIQELSGLLNIKVFAENVKNDKDLEIVKKFNLYGASR